MTEEFNLSGKIYNWPWTEFKEKEELALLKTKDVKEFIRLTLEDAGESFDYSTDFLNRLRKRAGDKLI